MSDLSEDTWLIVASLRRIASLVRFESVTYPEGRLVAATTSFEKSEQTKWQRCIYF